MTVPIAIELSEDEAVLLALAFALDDGNFAARVAFLARGREPLRRRHGIEGPPVTHDELRALVESIANQIADEVLKRAVERGPQP